MRSTTSLFAAAALAGFAAFALSACSSKENGGGNGSPYGGTLILAAPGDASTLFPPYIMEQNGVVVQDLVFDRLARIGPDNSNIGDKGFTPELAKSWTWSPDSLSIAFSLDPKARWHDGKPVTATDVQYTFKVFTDPAVASPVAPLLKNIDSVAIRDSLTPVFYFKKHTPGQFFDAAFELVILPEHVYGSIPAKELRTAEATRHLVGSGQFRFVRWDAGQRIELEADTANFRGRPKLDRIILLALADPAAAAAQILSGQADVMDNFPVDQAAKLDSNKYAKPVINALTAYAFMGMNPYARKSHTTPHPVFGDVRVRRALSMAVDRQGMLRNIFGNLGRIGYGPFSMAIPYADSATNVPAYDTTAAKALLDSAGWRMGANGVRAKNGVPLKFSLTVPVTSLPRRAYAVLIQEQLRKLGAQVDIDVIDPKAMIDRKLGGDFDAVLDAFNPDPTPTAEMQNWSTADIGPTGQNSLRYSNRTVDALMDSASTSYDPARVKSLMLRAHQRIVADAPAIWLYDYVSVLAIGRRFDYPPLRAQGWWTNLADWSVPPAKRIDRDRIGLAPAKP